MLKMLNTWLEEQLGWMSIPVLGLLGAVLGVLAMKGFLNAFPQAMYGV